MEYICGFIFSFSFWNPEVWPLEQNLKGVDTATGIFLPVFGQNCKKRKYSFIAVTSKIIQFRLTLYRCTVTVLIIKRIQFVPLVLHRKISAVVFFHYVTDICFVNTTCNKKLVLNFVLVNWFFFANVGYKLNRDAVHKAEPAPSWEKKIKHNTSTCWEKWALRLVYSKKT